MAFYGKYFVHVQGVCTKPLLRGEGPGNEAKLVLAARGYQIDSPVPPATITRNLLSVCVCVCVSVCVSNGMSVCPSRYLPVLLGYMYHSLAKKGPWAEHLTKFAKEGGGRSFDCFRI